MIRCHSIIHLRPQHETDDWTNWRTPCWSVFVSEPKKWSGAPQGSILEPLQFNIKWKTHLIDSFNWCSRSSVSVMCPEWTLFNKGSLKRKLNQHVRRHTDVFNDLSGWLRPKHKSISSPSKSSCRAGPVLPSEPAETWVCWTMHCDWSSEQRQSFPIRAKLFSSLMVLF